MSRAHSFNAAAAEYAASRPSYPPTIWWGRVDVRAPWILSPS